MSPIPVLSAHNFYRNPGGEDVVYSAEADLLRSYGHTVENVEFTNTAIEFAPFAAMRAVWNTQSHSLVRATANRHNIAIAHFHNTFPLMSPSVYYAAAGQGSAVVQTLHNYRLICPGALLWREERPCEECLDRKSVWPSLQHACYRSNRAATASAAATVSAHRVAGSYQNVIDAFIAPTEFARSKFIAGGLPADRIHVKPNFVSDVQPGSELGNFGVFVGRLSAEKGVFVLASAWGKIGGIPLKVLGNGPLRDIPWPTSTEYLGQQPRTSVLSYLRQARFLVFPSTWYEGDPLTILEAFACGTPVIASNLGSMAERVRHGYNGLLFRPGDPEDLAEKVRYAFTHPEHLAQMRINARREYEEKYTPERNYKMLIAIYEQAIENAKRRKRDAG